MNLHDLIGYLISFISAAIIATWRLASLKAEIDLKFEQVKTLIKQDTDHVYDKLSERISNIEHYSKIAEIKLEGNQKDQYNKINSLSRTTKNNIDSLTKLVGDIQDYLARSTRQCELPFNVRRVDLEKITLSQDESWSKIE